MAVGSGVRVAGRVKLTCGSVTVVVRVSANECVAVRSTVTVAVCVVLRVDVGDKDGVPRERDAVADSEGPEAVSVSLVVRESDSVVLGVPADSVGNVRDKLVPVAVGVRWGLSEAVGLTLEETVGWDREGDGDGVADIVGPVRGRLPVTDTVAAERVAEADDGEDAVGVGVATGVTEGDAVTGVVGEGVGEARRLNVDVRVCSAVAVDVFVGGTGSVRETKIVGEGVFDDDGEKK